MNKASDKSNGVSSKLDRASCEAKFAKIAEALSSFKCCQDKDIETFLHDKALDFLKRGWCSVFLLLDEEEFDEDRLKVEAYFTLSHKTILPPISISKSLKKRLTCGHMQAESIQFVLIGQLGKYIEMQEDGTTKRASITSVEILDKAFDVIRAADDLIPCRFVLVECNDKVKPIYENYKFNFLQNDGEHNQYFKPIE